MSLIWDHSCLLFVVPKQPRKDPRSWHRAPHDPSTADVGERLMCLLLASLNVNSLSPSPQGMLVTP